MPGGMEPKISLKTGPTCEWGEQPPEGTPVPNNTHSEQVGEMPRDSRRAPGPKETPTLNTTSWMERASTYLPCTRNLAVGSARARQSSPVERRWHSFLAEISKGEKRTELRVRSKGKFCIIIFVYNTKKILYFHFFSVLNNSEAAA